MTISRRDNKTEAQRLLEIAPSEYDQGISKVLGVKMPDDWEEGGAFSKFSDDDRERLEDETNIHDEEYNRGYAAMEDTIRDWQHHGTPPDLTEYRSLEQYLQAMRDQCYSMVSDEQHNTNTGFARGIIDVCDKYLKARAEYGRESSIGEAVRLLGMYNETITDNRPDAPDKEPEAGDQPEGGQVSPPPPVSQNDPFSPAGNTPQTGNSPAGTQPKTADSGNTTTQEWPDLGAKATTETRPDGTAYAHAHLHGRPVFSKQFACLDHAEDYIADWLDGLEHSRIVKHHEPSE